MIPAAVLHGDERRPRFHQPPCQQGALTPLMAAVLISQPGIFLVDEERLSRGRSRDEIERVLIEAVQGFKGPLAVGRAGNAVQLRVQCPPVTQAINA